MVKKLFQAEMCFYVFSFVMSFGVIVYLSSIHAGLFTLITLLIVIFTVTKRRVLYPLPRDSGVSIPSRLKASAAADTHRMCHLGACFMLGPAVRAPFRFPGHC